MLKANANKALIIFSLSPIYFETRVEALRLKKVAFASLAIALAKKVFPLPGGPYINIPLGGALIPVNRSGLRLGKINISLIVSFISSKPAMNLFKNFLN